jgi:hypothetical protein
MRLADLEKRVLDLERRTPTSDELGILIATMHREYYRSQGQPCRANVLDSELDRLAALPALPDGTSPLLTIAWEILQDNSAPQQKGEN